MNSIFTLVVSLLICNAFSQKENHTWVVGAKDVLTFDVNTNQPTASARTGYPDYTLEGCAIANNPANGEIYFYHDGHTVYTANHTPLPGATDIGSKVQGSTAQGAAIAVIPDCSNKRFYLFSNDADHSVFPFKPGNLYVTIIDMSSGTPVPSQVKTFVRNDLDESMLVIRNDQEGKAWLVTKLMNQNKIVSIPLTNNLSDIINTNNHIVSTFSTGNEVFESTYTIRYNPTRKLLALSGFLPAATVGTLQFNPSTGQASNFSFVDKQALNNQGNAQQSAIVDVCWSPDGSKLYALTQKHMSLYQYDFNNNRNRTIISQDQGSSDNGGMKVDPAGVLWVINNTLPVDPLNPVTSFNVSRIYNPNGAGGLCNFQLNDFTLLSNGYFYFPVHAEYPDLNFTASIAADGPTSLCPGDSVTLSCTGGSSWLWSNGATTQSITVAQSGSFSCEAFYFGTCSAQSQTINVLMNNNPVVDAGLDEVVSCGTKVDLLASSSSNVNFQWVGAPNVGPVYSQVGQGTYRVIATDVQTGCFAEDVVQVTEAGNNVVLNISADTTICLGESASIDAIVSGVNGTPQYQWSNGQTGNKIAVSPNSTQYYSVTVTDPNTSCSQTASSTVNVESLSVNLEANGALSFCEGGQVELVASPTDYDELVWSTGQEGMSSTSITTSGTFSFVMSRGVCTANSNTLTVEVFDRPEIEIIQSAEKVLIGEEVEFSIGGTSDAGTVFEWTFGKDIQMEERPVITYDEVGAYFVQLIAYSPNACSDTAYAAVEVTENEEEALLASAYLPNAFSPNGNGTNDRLNVVGENIREVEMLVANRWGEILFYSPNQLVGWDGNDLKGMPVPEGLYQATVKITGLDGKETKITRGVTLIRP